MDDCAIDHSLDNLLMLDGGIFNQDDGYWVKFEAKEVEVTEGRPFGVKYSLTLHDKHGERVMGYDNAHSVKLKKKGSANYKAKKITWDHKHEFKVVLDYEYSSAGQLVVDFWESVDSYLRNR